MSSHSKFLASDLEQPSGKFLPVLTKRRQTVLRKVERREKSEKFGGKGSNMAAYRTYQGMMERIPRIKQGKSNIQEDRVRMRTEKSVSYSKKEFEKLEYPAKIRPNVLTRQKSIEIFRKIIAGRDISQNPLLFYTTSDNICT